METQSRYFFKIVQSRSKECLFNIIASNLARKTIIWSDKWGSYSDLNNHFNDLTVNYLYSFINPITSVNTEKIQSQRSKLKKKTDLGRKKE
jgi:hypothetical protein